MAVSARDFVGKEFASLKDVRLEKETFGPVLRAARERRGVTLKQLALETKLSVELWEGLEENDLSRWPKRVFARSYVRDYALRVGLDRRRSRQRVLPAVSRVGRSPRRARHPREGADHRARSRVGRSSGAAAAPCERPRREPGAGISRLAIGCASSRSRSTSRRSLGLGCCRQALGFGYWPSIAVVAVSLLRSWRRHVSAAAFGLIASEWLFRMLKSIRATRRLLSSRAESA